MRCSQHCPSHSGSVFHSPPHPTGCLFTCMGGSRRDSTKISREQKVLAIAKGGDFLQPVITPFPRLIMWTHKKYFPHSFGAGSVELLLRGPLVDCQCSALSASSGKLLPQTAKSNGPAPLQCEGKHLASYRREFTVQELLQNNSTCEQLLFWNNECPHMWSYSRVVIPK